MTESKNKEEIIAEDELKGADQLDRMLGIKVGMSQLFLEDGTVVPVTVIDISGNIVVQRKTGKHDGYEAVQIGIGYKKEKTKNRALRGHLAKAKTPNIRWLREMRVSENEVYTVGSQLKGDVWHGGDFVDVSGYRKGRGFAGVMKRHGFSGAPASHGTHEYFRHGGSVGQCSSPSKVFKNLRMPGRMGAQRCTVQNLQVIKFIPEEGLLLVKGAVPGSKHNLLEIRKSIKRKNKADASSV